MNKTRVVCVLGGKGGVGKTTFAGGLFECYRSNELKCFAIDADTGNAKHGSLCHLIGCTKSDIRSRIGLDVVIDHALSGEYDVVLVDFGAGTVDELTKWMGDVGEALKSEGVAFTLAAILTEELATAEAVLRCVEKTKDAADYVLVENQSKGDVSLSVERLTPFIEAMKPVRILLEALRPDLAQELDRVGQTAADAVKSPKSDLLKGSSARIRMQAWTRKLNEQILNCDFLMGT